MRTLRTPRALALGLALAAAAWASMAATAAHAAAPGWRTVRYDGISLRVPGSWPVLDLAAHPAVCPRLDVHAVYLGAPGPHPSCPAGGLGAKTEAVQITRAVPGGPDSLAATRHTVIGGHPARTNADSALTHTIIDIIGGAYVSLSYGRHPGLIAAVQASITVSGALPSTTGPQRAPQPGQAQGIYTGGGFDACSAPDSGTMNAWLASPYRAVGVYIGGINRACAQPSLTASWVNTVEGQGWKVFPLYPGLQAPCVNASGDATFTAGNAAAEGKASADDAATQAQNLGFPAGTPLVYDMEAYSGCGSAVITFLNAWDNELHTDGYGAGVYESFSNVSDLIGANGSMTEPDVIDYAAWDGDPTTSSSYMPSNMWTNHQRIHQYAGGHNETWGGATINIDNDQLDVNLGSVALTSHGGFHIATAINTSGTAEMFALAANGTLVHDYQDPSGNEGWSGWYAVGNSPSNLVSNPSVAHDQAGYLEVFARNSSGQIMHAWQSASAPDGWQWGTPAGTGSPGATTGDPHAIQRPDGDVAVFVTDTNGTVATTAQTTPNGSWGAWANIGGSCRGWPIPFVDANKQLELFCRTTAGTLAMNTWSGTAWRGWATVGGSPTNLTSDPGVVSNADGRTEVFAMTTSGGIDHAWENMSASTWTWGVPLASDPSGATLRNTPTAIRWPDGRVEVFFEMSNGQLGHVYQLAANGTTGWSAISSLGGTVLGSPEAWLNTSGTAEVAALDANLQIAHTYYANGGWIGWVQLGGSF